MLNKMIAKNMILSKQVFLLSQRTASFASLNNAMLDHALTHRSDLVWQQFFNEIKAADVQDSDPKTVGKLLKVLTLAAHSKEAAQQTDLLTAIDEYFRLRFRKISS